MSHGSTKIAFQGYAGAYSDLACRSAYPARAPLPCNSFEDAFQAVQTGEAALAMIPVDNTLAGRVADVHHLLPEGGLYIIGEHFQPIRHALLGVPGTKSSELKHVHSHVHAIPQCREMIRRLELQAHVHVDTAGAAEEIARRGDRAHAAIASSLAAEIYGLDVLNALSRRKKEQKSLMCHGRRERRIKRLKMKQNVQSLQKYAWKCCL